MHMSNTTDTAETNAVAPAKASSSRLNAFYVGGFLALVFVSIKTLTGVTSVFVGDVMPYIAGVGMFAALIAIFAVLIGTLKSVRKVAKKEAAIWDCYVAVAIIGTMGYFLAACVATFQHGADPSEFWTAGATSAACFAMLFGGGKYAAELFNAGKNAK
jgi:hypothetical protein